jgi:peptidoglycan/xylan/chitin deacetylase (PgdA/CDA1 family)
MSNETPFWPNDARLAVSISLMYEGGGQPISGAPGVIPDPVRQGLPDMPTNGVFQYGIYEGTPRLLDLMDKHDVKLSAFMVGQAVDKDPHLASEVVRRGHEAAAHGRIWSASYDLSPNVTIVPAAARKFRRFTVLTSGVRWRTGLKGQRSAGALRPRQDVSRSPR